MIDWMVAYPLQYGADSRSLVPCELLARSTVDEHELDTNVQGCGDVALTTRAVIRQGGRLLRPVR